MLEKGKISRAFSGLAPYTEVQRTFNVRICVLRVIESICQFSGELKLMASKIEEKNSVVLGGFMYETKISFAERFKWIDP